MADSQHRGAPRPLNEEERLRSLRSYEILDTLPEVQFDEIVELASELCGVPIALMSLVDDERQWFKSKVGLEATETHRDFAFCAHAILQESTLIVPDATQDDRFAQNPLVTSDPHVRFYAGTPLRTPSGVSLGTLCVIDREPRVMTPLQLHGLEILGKQIEAQLELRRAMRELLAHVAEVSAQRDAIIDLQWQRKALASHVVHDLKSPLGIILLDAEFVASEAESSDDVRAAAASIVSSVNQMNDMVVSLLAVSNAEDGALVPVLENVELAPLLMELQQAASRSCSARGQRITVGVGPSDCVRADRALLRRVIENLIANAIKYGGSDVSVSALACADGSVELAVCDNGEGVPECDNGEGVPEASREAVFDRYARLDRDANNHAEASGGLGLTFCRLALEAHGGRIWVEQNTPQGAAFRMRFPKRELRQRFSSLPAAP